MGEKKNSDETPKRALYRQYRSTSFDEVVGQDHVTELLKNAVEKGNVSHAYLFTGPKGTGKTSVARILAYSANNLPYELGGQSLDVIEIDAASNRRIDDIRDLREKVHIAPVSEKYKVYIIDEVHMLTGESFNALLKTLEEPPAHVIFILATTELHKVPATIVSRTQRFHFRPVSIAKVTAHLSKIAKQEKIAIDQPALELIAEHGGGSFRDSIGLLDQLAGLKKSITTDLVESLLGRAGEQQIVNLLKAIDSRQPKEVQRLLAELQSDGTSPVTLAEQLVRRLLLPESNLANQYELAERLMDIPRANFPQLMLSAILLKHAQEPQTAKQQAVTKPAKQVTQELVDPKPPTTPKQTMEPKTATGQPKTGKFDWEKVLEVAKKNHPALYSVLSRAIMTFDDTKVTLVFQYALHRKKLEQPMYRTQLARLIEDTCQVNPEIIVESSSPQLADNETTNKVAEIMGGGEVVKV